MKVLNHLLWTWFKCQYSFQSLLMLFWFSPSMCYLETSLGCGHWSTLQFNSQSLCYIDSVQFSYMCSSRIILRLHTQIKGSFSPAPSSPWFPSPLSGFQEHLDLLLWPESETFRFPMFSRTTHDYVHLAVKQQNKSLRGCCPSHFITVACLS